MFLSNSVDMMKNLLMGKQHCLEHFEDRVMKKAHHVKVEEYACNDYGLLYVEKFSPKQSEDLFYFDPPTNVMFLQYL